ncbi:MAG: GerMN domain-containing protein [Treponema sp.]|nr:GerMN domain-containing protein [Treponema sp.]
MNKSKTPAAKKPAQPPKKSVGSKTTNGKTTGGKSKPQKKPWGTIFWVIFFLFVVGLFFFNRNTIIQTLQESQQNSMSQTVPAAPDQSLQNQAADNINSESQDQIQNVPAGPDSGIADSGPETLPPPADNQSPDSSVIPVQNTANLDTQLDSSVPAAVSSAPAAQPAARVQDRTVYFINIDRDGTILRTRVSRSLPVTESPLTDTINALLAGPEPDEQSKGLISLIPQGTRIVNATVRENTAYINLNEDFQFNTYGVEGYAGALRQIVWTATEFPNVKDVQILIEGRKIDYLGEGVWIGSPINRDSF